MGRDASGRMIRGFDKTLMEIQNGGQSGELPGEGRYRMGRRASRFSKESRQV